jgi:hypothetical protein
MIYLGLGGQRRRHLYQLFVSGQINNFWSVVCLYSEYKLNKIDDNDNNISFDKKL